MFIEQGIRPQNKFGRYLIGSLIIIVAAFVGQIPFGVAIALKSISNGKMNMPTESSDLMGYLEPNLSLFLLLLSFVFALAAIFLVIKYLHRQTILSVTTSRPKVDWKRIFFAFGIWAVFNVITLSADYFSSPEHYVVSFHPMKFAIMAVIAIAMIPIQTSTEEYVFRGYLMQGFGNLARNRWFPLVMTSVIFGSMHIFNPEVDKMGYFILIYYIGTGFFLGILTLMDEGMELSLGFHAANNLIGALLVTSDWSAIQTYSVLKDVSEPTAGYEVILPVFIIFPILLFIFSKKYRWSDWKQKLTGDIIIPNPIETHANPDSDLS
ncbi:MAG: CPBP family intramembrane metalloprotease [Flavobacterium sp.]|nr:MAG: CPBP family intramembrane metalloprotease [Flavobacterium sp.]